MQYGNGATGHTFENDEAKTFTAAMTELRVTNKIKCSIGPKQGRYSQTDGVVLHLVS